MVHISILLGILANTHLCYAAEWTDEQLSYDFVIMEPYYVTDDYNFDTSPWESGSLSTENEGIGQAAPAPDATPSGTTAQGNLGSIPTNGTPPYNQTTNKSCTVATVRNIIDALKPGSAPSESRTADLMRNACSSFDATRYMQNGTGTPPSDFAKALNAALNSEGIYMGERTHFDTYAGFNSAMQNALDNKMVFVALMDIPALGKIGNAYDHAVMITPVADANGQLIGATRTNPDANGNASVTTMSLEEAARFVADNFISSNTGEPETSKLWAAQEM